jgi:transcriptional regulator with XRE-family HTH domain
MLMPREETTTETIGRTIRSLRMSLGITQIELARRCGITHQQLHKYEHARNAVSMARMVTLARAMGMPPSTFVAEVEKRLTHPAGAAAPMVEQQTLNVVAYFERIANDEAKRHVVRLLREMARAQPATRSTDWAPPVTLADVAASNE